MARIKQLIEEEIPERPLRSELDANGHEIPDPIPMAPPIGYLKQPSMIENIRAMIRSENLRREAESAGKETFDEADDLDDPEADDYEPSSPYEMRFEPTPVNELRRRQSDASKPPAPSPEPSPPVAGSAPAPAPAPSPDPLKPS